MNKIFLPIIAGLLLASSYSYAGHSSGYITYDSLKSKIETFVGNRFTDPYCTIRYQETAVGLEIRIFKKNSNDDQTVVVTKNQKIFASFFRDEFDLIVTFNIDGAPQMSYRQSDEKNEATFMIGNNICRTKN